MGVYPGRAAAVKRNIDFTVKHFCFFALLWISPALAQTWMVDSLVIPQATLGRFVFPERHLPVPATLEIYINHRKARPELDYRMEARAIRFMPPLQQNDTLRVRYRRHPINLRRRYTLFRKDTLRAPEGEASNAPPRVIVHTQNIGDVLSDFGAGLQKRGSIVRGINIGSNRDLALNSGLNLELSGHLNENMEIVAALTDESTPIQPQGNTQTLDEIDRVFVQFKSPFLTGTVGDIYYETGGTRFGNIKRKLQGITLTGTVGAHRLELTGATTRGLVRRQTFIGREGNQGPYQLTGNNGEREIIVLAGTEQVWLNGEKLTRGESNDYVIEYGNGELSFTNRRLITGDSRIEVDFEYFPANRRFNRDDYGAAYTWQPNEDATVTLRYFREKDNTSRLTGREGGFTSEERAALAAAGDDPLKAFVDGAQKVEAGKGTYVKSDTTFQDSVWTIYRYVGTGAGDYTVSFSFVGKRNGAYVRDRLGQYRWTGPQSGDYMPVKLLPLPQDHQSAQLVWKQDLTENINVRGEYAVSRFDANTLARGGGTLRDGQAAFVALQAGPVEARLFGVNWGQFSADMQATYVDDRFRSPDRLNAADYQRYWNILGDNGRATDEKSWQLTFRYVPVKPLSWRVNGGWLDKGAQSTRRLNSALTLKRGAAGSGFVKWTTLNSTDRLENIDNIWQRLNVSYGYDLYGWEPRLLYDFEHRKNEKGALLSGFLYEDAGMRLAALKGGLLRGYVEWRDRRDRVYDVEGNGALIPQAGTRTGKLHLTLQGLKQTSVVLDVQHRQKRFEDHFKNIQVDTLKLLYADAAVQDTVWRDSETNLAELRVGHARWKNAFKASLRYRVSTDQTALREKVYVKVDPGRGTLRYDEDLKEYVPDPDGDYVLFILSSGRFEPVTRLEAAVRLNYDGAGYWKRPAGTWQKMWAALSGVTYLRVDESTKERRLADIYLLKLNRFQGAQTLRGAMVYDQDIYIMKRNRALNFRLQFRYRDDLSNQFLDATDNESRLNVEKAARVDWRIMPTLKTRSEWRYRNVSRINPASPKRDRAISGLSFTENVTARIVGGWEWRMDAEYGNERNRTDRYPMRLWYARVKPQINYTLPGTARMTLDYEYQTVKVTDNPFDLAVPYEMARGRKEGVSQRWQARFEYNISRNILINVTYTGRDEAGFKKVIHTGQAEVRAYF